MHSATYEQFLADYPCIIELPVQWGEMDAFHHVNNVAYFRYFESSSIALFNKTSLMESKRTQGIGPILAEQSCRYRRAVSFPDTIKIGSRVTTISDSTFLQDYAIYSTAQDAITTLATSRTTVINYATGKKVMITGDLLTELEALRSADPIQ